MSKIIILDFDGTCVSHEFPHIGKDIGAVPVLKELVANGHRLVLFTMRSDIANPVSSDPSIVAKCGRYLSEAVEWFRLHDIPLWGIQTNPEQRSWTTSPKAYGNLVIDDAALGIPLVYDPDVSNRPFVCWKTVRNMLKRLKLI